MLVNYKYPFEGMQIVFFFCILSFVFIPASQDFQAGLRRGPPVILPPPSSFVRRIPIG